MAEKLFFEKGQKLVAPELASTLGHSSPLFAIVELYAGGMGTCAKIQHLETEELYALKIIHNSLLLEDKALRRYIEEIKTWLALSACNSIVEALCLTQVNQVSCIAARWMEKGSLRDFMSYRDPLFFYKSLDRIISALDWAFSRYKIIHRDIKPENILLDVEGNTYVSDWGLARPIGKSSDVSDFAKAVEKLSNRVEITEAGSFIGTVLYSAPEQILGLQTINHRADIYSLGCLMYEWETGRPPFIAATAQDIAYMHLNTKPRPIGGLFKTTTFKVEKIILKCLEKDPENRYQTYNELLRDLRQVAAKDHDFVAFQVVERYKSPVIGANEIENEFREIEISPKGYAVVDLDDMMPYLKEAENLMSLNEFAKAIKIFERFYIKDVFEKHPDFWLHGFIATDYGHALDRTHQTDKAIEVFKSVENAEKKSAAYYVNFSCAYISKSDWLMVENICRDGLKHNDKDIGLLGNLTIALTNQGRFEEAYDSALTRLKINRNINSLTEMEMVHYALAEHQKHIDFPNAVKHYRTALSYLYEAKELNPRYELIRLHIANILFKLRKYEASAEEATTVCNTTDNHRYARQAVYFVARNLLWLSGYAQCVAFCDKWLQLYPDSIKLQRIRAEALVEDFVVGNYEDGARVIEKSSLDFFSNIVKDVVLRKPSDFEFLARIYEWMGDDENTTRALLVLEEGQKIFPNHWLLYFIIARSYQQKGAFDTAVKHAMKAKSIAPWREHTYFLIAAILKSKGANAEADKYELEGQRIKELKTKLYSESLS